VRGPPLTSYDAKNGRERNELDASDVRDVSWGAAGVKPATDELWCL
jgi:hypothetical protein